MDGRLRLTVVTLLAAGGLVAVASPAAACRADGCPSRDVLVVQLRADGFTAPAANTFAGLIRRDCA